MKFGKIALAASAASLAVAPVAMAAERVSAPVSGESTIGGGDDSLIAAGVFALIVIGAFVAFGGDDEPVSP